MQYTGTLHVPVVYNEYWCEVRKIIYMPYDGMQELNKNASYRICQYIKPNTNDEAGHCRWYGLLAEPEGQ